MSLVNDMLKDLDKRKRAPLQSGQTGVAIDYADDGNNLPYKKIGIITGLGVLVGLIAANFLLDETPQEPVNSGATPVQEISLTAVTGAPPIEQAIPESSPVNARIAGGRETSTGFEIRIEVTQQVPYEILSRSDTRLQLLIKEVEEIGNTTPVISGMAVMRSSDGMLLSLDLDRAADFLVYENSIGQLFAITVEGFWSDTPLSTSQTRTISENLNIAQPVSQGNSTEDTAREVAQENTSNNSGQSIQPTRTTREFSLLDRDRNASQQALRYARDGALIEALGTLYNFIGENPEAHQSRNTLATLLFAQQEFIQANAVLDEGLALAPNHAGYKKIKARLLIPEGEFEAAIRLLNTSPPAITDDSEYFELLSSIYQQNNNHGKAIEIYQELIRTDSTVGRWWVGMAISHEALGNTDDALNSYQVALQTENLDARLRQYGQSRIRVLRTQ